MEKNSGMQHGPTRFMQLSVICLISNLHIQGRIGRLAGWHFQVGRLVCRPSGPPRQMLK